MMILDQIQVQQRTSIQATVIKINKLGVIYRLGRTLRELIEKQFHITGHRTDNIKDIIKTIIDTYTSCNYITLNNKTPNQVFEDNDDQQERHMNDSLSLHNQRTYQSVPFEEGQKVRISERKEILIKESRYLVKSYIQQTKGRIQNISKR